MDNQKFTNNYQIRTNGHLDQRWFDSYENLSITHTLNGETLISGVMDQSALYGTLNRIRDLGMELISVQRSPIESEK